MNRREALVALNMVGGIGSSRLKKLLEYFDKPQDIFHTSREKLTAVSGIAGTIAEHIKSLSEEDVHREFRQAEKLSLSIITFEEEAYPENLKQIYDPPLVLYVKGKLIQKDICALAIVGSRKASFYGLSSAQRFAAELSGLGFTIVSGMARGIDTASHKGALKVAGRTIAVMGSGFQQMYPPENKELAEEIAGNGAVISEFPIDTEPLPQNFPRRNRVISGLSLGVLVVEAARNSGALITADCALEQGREVFALPGKLDSGNSFGTLGLLKDGAKLVTCLEDIIEEFGFLPTFRQNRRESGFCPTGNPGFKPGRGSIVHTQEEPPVKREEPSEKVGAPQESLLLGALSETPASLDYIAEETRLGIPQVCSLLLRLKLQKLVKELPGKQFVRTA